MGDKTYNPDCLFAIEVEPSSSDLSANLAAYRRLSAKQKAAVAAELRRKVEVEIAEETKATRRGRHEFAKNGRSLFRVRTTLIVKKAVEFIRSLSQGGQMVLAVHLADHDPKMHHRH